MGERRGVYLDPGHECTELHDRFQEANGRRMSLEVKLERAIESNAETETISRLTDDLNSQLEAIKAWEDCVRKNGHPPVLKD